MLAMKETGRRSGFVGEQRYDRYDDGVGEAIAAIVSTTLRAPATRKASDTVNTCSTTMIDRCHCGHRRRGNIGDQQQHEDRAVAVGETSAQASRLAALGGVPIVPSCVLRVVAGEQRAFFVTAGETR